MKGGPAQGTGEDQQAYMIFTVVMITDGAVSVSDEWIGAMMRDFEGSDIQELVNDIIDEATIGSKLCPDDDITVIGMRIMDN